MRLGVTIIFCFSVFAIGNAAISTKHVEGDLRLKDGDSFSSGTVSVFRGYTWGRVCDDNWSIREANVVCRQMGLGFAVRALKRNHFHSKSGRFYFMDNVKCHGNETRLTDCDFDGWARHDCSYGEDAGVQCAEISKPREKIKWNPLKLDYSQEQLKAMKKVLFALSTVNATSVNYLSNDTEAISKLNSSILETQFEEKKTNTNEPGWEKYLSSLTHEIEKTRILVVRSKGDSKPNAGAICPDHFNTVDAIVVCRQLGLGIGGKVIEVPMHSNIFPTMKHVALIGHCFGNETDLSKCATFIDGNGVKCKSQKAVAVECRTKLPDLVPDVYFLESSVHIQRLRLWHLECALEEHCFPDSVYTYIANNPGRYHWDSRTLLRFSSITKNVGTAPFLPSLIPEHWEWHPCHAHYHSMKVFGRYEVIDSMDRLVTYGHKASFCLEDNTCDRNATKFFQCSNVMDTKGKQGISPGCQDEYFFNYDCQWVDITDIPQGEYTYQVSYNPDFLVAEDNYFNNAVTCKMTYRGNWARFSECKIVHPYDLV